VIKKYLNQYAIYFKDLESAFSCLHLLKFYLNWSIFIGVTEDNEWVAFESQRRASGHMITYFYFDDYGYPL